MSEETDSVSATVQQAILAIMDGHEKAWNRGDIQELLDGYWRDDRLRYAFNDEVHHSYANIEASFLKRYPGPATMGKLAFTDVEISVLSDCDALVFGRWTLERDDTQTTGLLTVHFRKIDGAWLTVSDHTSSG